jgi:hypothetical protein
MMGVRIPNDDFSHVNLPRELEDAISSLPLKNAPKTSLVSTLFIKNSLGDSTPLSLDWASSSASFTLVESRKGNSGKRKPNVVVSRPLTRIQKASASKGTTSTMSPGRSSRKKI